jgi:hypothetical protein
LPELCGTGGISSSIAAGLFGCIRKDKCGLSGLDFTEQNSRSTLTEVNIPDMAT